MERIQALIDKLWQQKQQSSHPSQLLLTVQLLHSELILLQQSQITSYKPKVAVTMPVHYSFADEREMDKLTEEIKSVERKIQNIPSYIEPYQENITSRDTAELMFSGSPVEIPKENKEINMAASQSSFFNPALETSNESPTLIQHQSREIHEIIGTNKESLNDRLKQEKTEIVNVLKEAPIKDLRRGIGINDRFTFVSELFRGDEAMYERSIKTINDFNILSEAEYWINRELKFKLGWSDAKEIVQHFYQLVRRRFASM